MITLFFFLFGIVIGSFLNVVISRLQTQETILGRSHCTKCLHRIAWYDNIPLLSFAILRGKCRHCRERISWQYPVVELATGLSFASVAALFFSITDPASWLLTGFYLGLFSMLIVVFVHDLLTMYIPMTTAWMAIVWAFLYLVISRWLFPETLDLYARPDMAASLFSGIGAAALFWFLVRVSDETWMGMGDVYLALLMGFVLGWPGVLWGMTLSFGSGAVVGLLLIAFGKKGMKSQVPFAPFMVFGIALTLLLPQLFPVLRYLMILE